MSSQSISYKRNVRVPVMGAYRAFTNATALREWLCDVATVQPREGGRLYLAWNSGYYVSGKYLFVEPNKKVVFSWRGQKDPTPTQVKVSMMAEEGNTQIELEHTGLGSGSEWETIRSEILDVWETGLENLVSVLETGEDLRFTRRPMLGITISEFNDEIAKNIGLSITGGIRLDTVLDGMGAKEAGLIPDDIIIEIAGKPVVDWASLANALQPLKAGDQVEVKYYRDGEKKIAEMKLSSRLLPEIPTNQKELANMVRNKFDEIESDLDKLLADVNDSEASYKIGIDEWSIKENLAHLIHGERFTQNWIYQLLGSQEQVADDWGGNDFATVAATVAANPKLLDLRDQYRRSIAESVALIELLPDDFVARKGSYWRLAHSLLEGSTHFYSHVEQIRNLISSAREEEISS